MFDVPIEAAKSIHNFANTALIVAIVTMTGATILTMWMGGIIARHTEERISMNERESAEAHERAAVLEKDAAEARLETERVKELISWRRLAPAQAAALAAHLGELEYPIHVMSVLGNLETRQYANDFERALISAGVEVKSSAGAGADFPMIGIIVLGPKEKVETLVKALASAFIPSQSRIEAGQDLYLIVGAREIQY